MGRDQGQAVLFVTLWARCARLLVVAALALAGFAGKPATADDAAAITLSGAQITLYRASAIQRAIIAGSLHLDPTDRLFLLHIDLDEGWKTYWRLPGRFGLAPALSWVSDGAETQAEPSFPAPALFEEAGGWSIGYDAPVVWALTIPGSAPHPDGLLLDFGLCEIVCVRETIGLSVPADDTSNDLSLAAVAHFAEHLPRPARPLSELVKPEPADAASGAHDLEWNLAALPDASMQFAVLEGASRHSLVVVPSSPEPEATAPLSNAWPYDEAIQAITIIDRSGTVHPFHRDQTMRP